MQQTKTSDSTLGFAAFCLLAGGMFLWMQFSHASEVADLQRRLDAAQSRADAYRSGIIEGQIK